MDAAVLLVELERRLSALRGNVTPAFLSEWWDTPASQSCQHARPKETTYARRARHRQKACAALSRAPLSLSRLRKVRGSVPSRGPAEWRCVPQKTASVTRGHALWKPTAAPISHVHVPPGQPSPSELPARALRRAIFFACLFWLRAALPASDLNLLGPVRAVVPSAAPLPGTPPLEKIIPNTREQDFKRFVSAAG